MLLEHLIAPIAAATVVNVFLFATAWRANRDELRTGATSWIFLAVAMAYLGLLAFGLYATRGKPLASFPELFLAALVAELLGGVIVYAILNGLLWTRGRPIRERVGPVLIAGFLSYLMIAAAFQ